MFLTETLSLPRVPLSLLRLTRGSALLVLWHHVIVLNLFAPGNRSQRRAPYRLFPDCGCKITAFFADMQVFLKSFYVLKHILAVIPYPTKFSKYVKIYFVMLIL